MNAPDRRLAALDSTAEHHRTVWDGGKLTWRSWGEGEPLVLLHGDFGSWTHWFRNIEPLAEQYRVIAADMPGYGQSDMPDGDYTTERVAAILSTGLAEIVPPPQTYRLAGFSFGGIVAGHLAARDGDRVSHLALIGPGGFGIHRADQLPAVRRPPRNPTPTDIAETHRANLAALMIGDPAEVDDLAIHIQHENIRRARARCGAIPETDALWRVLPDVTARLSGIWGTRDAFAGPHTPTVTAMLRGLRPETDIRLIDEAGHWAIYEAADTVNAMLLNMLTVDG